MAALSLGHSLASAEPGVPLNQSAVQAPRRNLRGFAGAALAVSGGLLLLLSQGYLLLVSALVVSTAFGWLGVLLLLVLPPLWLLTPLLLWGLSGTFPLTYFVVWIGGLFGSSVLMWTGSAMTSRSSR